ncbi:hypothetical protein EGJ86_19485 [Pseudomonas sp. o96-267]|uniref:hypothetical protein n=1 Tax=Pseudomonas sp. o96-267 TaxID=2479853 RepID=UPI000F76DF43|nr:hypothetical protein [Pseudomonas sp. o96-267]RRV31756.1 hypothetical protein EGJ86_19485 [Pseudomonas sp. o96-267]
MTTSNEKNHADTQKKTTSKPLLLGVAIGAAVMTGLWSFQSTYNAQPGSPAIYGTSQPEYVMKTPIEAVKETPQPLTPLAPTGAACEEVAQQEEAYELLKKLFPAASFLSAEPLAFGNTKSCLLEVEMLADQDNPKTKGFVYVLPDGEHFLNGPLMNKRSDISLGNGDLSADVQQALNEQRAVIDDYMSKAQTRDKSQGQGLTRPQQPQPQPQPQTEQNPLSTQLADSFKGEGQTPPTPEQLRIRLLSKLKEFDALETGTGPNDVYVLFDPNCNHCRNLHAQSEKLAKERGITFHFIPMFLNETSWAMSALVMKEMKSSPENADSLLKSMMAGKWKLNSTEGQRAIGTLQEGDYAAVKPATGLFVELHRANTRIGTPLIAFKNSSGGVDVISGMPHDDDWKSLPVAN